VAEPAAGTIYDLGYQRCAGTRLGRRHAVWALYRENLRGAFGLGRRAAAKIAPVSLVLIAVGPALLTILGGYLAAQAGAKAQVTRHDEYYQLVILVLALYVAVVAPDVVGREQRNRSLTLYFTGAMSRADYVAAKFLALTSAMLLITLVPQLVLWVGNALVAGIADSFGEYLRDNLHLIPPIFGTALLGSALIASIGAAVAAQTPHRGFATVAVVATFLLTTVFSAALVSIDSPITRLAIFLSPENLLQGATAWMFGVSPGEQSQLPTAGYPLELYAPAALAVTVACYALFLWRYQRVWA
jgi:ABC-2 type transport system permease protein